MSSITKVMESCETTYRIEYRDVQINIGTGKTGPSPWGVLTTTPFEPGALPKVHSHVRMPDARITIALDRIANNVRQYRLVPDAIETHTTAERATP